MGIQGWLNCTVWDSEILSEMEKSAKTRGIHGLLGAFNKLEPQVVVHIIRSRVCVKIEMVRTSKSIRSICDPSIAALRKPQIFIAWELYLDDEVRT